MINKIIILLAFVSMLVFGCFNVQSTVADESLTDGTGDVFYQAWGTGEIINDVSSQPNIDISSVTYETDDTTLTITINVVGEITESFQILYYAECESSDATYQFTYRNHSLTVFVETDSGKLPVVSEVDVVGNVLVVMIPLQTEASIMSDLYAYAHYYEDPDKLMSGSKYIDTTEDVDNPAGLAGDSSRAPPGTPGFKLVVFLAAIVIIVGIIKKR